MRRTLLALLLGLAAGPTPRAAAAEPAVPQVSPAEAGLDPAKLKLVDQFMDAQVAQQKLAGGVVLVAHRGRIVHFQAYGKANLDTGAPMATDTIVRIYSMSKAITTAAALTLVDTGKLKLDDPVAKYLPELGELKVATAEGLRAPKRAMTIQDLMLHTAGFTYGGGPKEVAAAFFANNPMTARDLKQMTERVARIPLARDPGAEWEYSISIDVLGRVVEVASGQALDQYLQKTLFEPLQMVDTGFSVPESKVARFAANYTRGKDGLKMTDNPARSSYGGKVTLFSGGGGLVGTARDYLHFLLMVEQGGTFQGRRILRPESVQKMTTNQLPEALMPIRFGKELRHGTGFTLGFSVRTEVPKTWDPAGHVGEYGWGGAASTHYWVSPKDQLIAITLEQVMPYQWDTEFGLKPLIYDALPRSK